MGQRLPWFLLFAVIGGCLAVGVGVGRAAPSPSPPRPRVVLPGIARDGTPPARTPYPAVLPCGDILVPVDKQHGLPADCEPPDLVELDRAHTAGSLRLRAAAASAFESMIDTGAGAGLWIGASSAYRSYAEQAETFDYWVSVLGLDQAERTSARAGHSEHQLGTTIDLCGPSGCLEGFSGSAEANWVASHAVAFGFVVSYPEEKEGVTGYVGEAWHIRYVGREVALRVQESGLTLHEFLLR